MLVRSKHPGVARRSGLHNLLPPALLGDNRAWFRRDSCVPTGRWSTYRYTDQP